MRIFKFGGASLKDAKNVLNTVNIIAEQGGRNQLLVVVSAMGKTTNSLESLLKAYWQKENYELVIKDIESYDND
jgi:aspartate kinase